ncbi:MAG: hypothetical protein IJU01_02100 [Lachnospiraceae bacterium]|nr:hypothetical protein [Lachnospiraceae bacterium]
MKKQGMLTSLIVISAVAALFFAGCGKPKYNVDYNGKKALYLNAEDSYEEGEQVNIVYKFIATDTDYTFTLDGEKLNVLYDDNGGFVISFVMPGHDVKLDCTQKNSMLADDVPEIEADVMLVDYYSETTAGEGAGGYYEIVFSTYTAEESKITVYTKENADSQEYNSVYIVPAEAKDEIFVAIEENGLENWGDRDEYEILEGARITVQFRNESEEIISVSSDKMPSYGEEAFAEIRAALEAAIADLTEKPQE